MGTTGSFASRFNPQRSLGTVLWIIASACAATSPEPSVAHAPAASTSHEEWRMPTSVPSVSTRPSLTDSAPTQAANEETDPPRAISSVDSLIAASRWRFRNCYSSALKSDPSAAGDVRVRIQLAPDGSVLQATHTGSLPLHTRECIAHAFRLMKFPPPDVGATSFAVPLKFAPTANTTP